MAQPAMSTETRTSFEIKMIQAGHAGADRRVVYECNFSVDSEIAQQFMQYLRAHMREVRRGPGPQPAGSWVGKGRPGGAQLPYWQGRRAERGAAPCAGL